MSGLLLLLLLAAVVATDSAFAVAAGASIDTDTTYGSSSVNWLFDCSRQRIDTTTDNRYSATHKRCNAQADEIIYMPKKKKKETKVDSGKECRQTEEDGTQMTKWSQPHRHRFHSLGGI